MPTWEDVQTYARDNYTLKADTEDFFALEFSYENERTQLIAARRITAFEEEWVQLRSLVSKNLELSPKDLLTRSGELAIGAIVLDEGKYFLTHTASLAAVEGDLLDRLLKVVAYTADTLEKEFTGE